MNIKKVLAGIVVLTLILSQTVVASEYDTSILITDNITPTEVNREFKVDYSVEVGVSTAVEYPAVVLVLDRSGSMLWRDRSGNLVVDAIKGAVDDFVSNFFLGNPGGDLAIVSFGSNANAHDNYKYYNSAQEALEEIDFIYEYGYDKYGYLEWKNWQPNQGNTNMGEAFYYSARTVELDKKSNPYSSDVVIMFTDGVANTFTKGNDPNGFTSSYPTSHNASTLYAIEEANLTQNLADVITVGYFGAYSYYPQTKAIAEDTLYQSQNAGFYKSDTLVEVNEMFDQVYQNIQFIGTGATVTDVINPEFEVIESSIEPSGATVSVDPVTGKTTITWDVGNLYSGTFDFSYEIRTKEDAYPSGKDYVVVNDIHALGAGLSYYDLDDVLQTVLLPEVIVNIPAHENLPEINLDIVYNDGSEGKYLIGDQMDISHNLSYTNLYTDPVTGEQLLFDFVEIDVSNFIKAFVSAGDLGTLPLTEVLDLDMNNWYLENNRLYADIHENAVSSGFNLPWSKSIPLYGEALIAGEFVFSHGVNYDLYNPYYDSAFVMDKEDWMAHTIYVENGTVKVTLTNDLGMPISNASILVYEAGTDTLVLESSEYDRTVESSGVYTMDHITTGQYDVVIKMPSGHKLIEGYTYNLTEDGDVIIENQTLNYENPVIDISAQFEAMDIGNISIETVEGSHHVYGNTIDETYEVRMYFSTFGDFDKLKIPIVDTFTFDGDISIDPASLRVTDIDGNPVGGFYMTGNTMDFTKFTEGATGALPQGNYVASFTITGLPYGLTGQETMLVDPKTEELFLGAVPGFDFDITVTQTHAAGVGEVSYTTRNTTANPLSVTYDEIGPVVEFVPSVDDFTDDDIYVDVIITSDYTETVTYRLNRVTSVDDVSRLSGLYNGYGFSSINSSDPFDITGKFDVMANEDLVETASVGFFVGNGYYGVMAVDQAGNVTIEIIDIYYIYFDPEFNELL